MEDIILERMAKNKSRYDYYNNKGNEEKSYEYLSLLLADIESLLVEKGVVC